MTRLRIFWLCLACCASFGAAAQWQWVDKDGRKVFSDRPPPPEISDKSILKQPVGTKPRAADAPAAGASAPAAGASAPLAAASVPKLSGKDNQLEAKRKEAEAQEAAKQKAKEEKDAKGKAEACQRARASKSSIDSGVRLQTTNEQGEREFMSDEARAAESARLQGILGDCP